MIQNYRDDLPAPSNKRRLGEINDEKRPQKRMSQDYAGTSTSHQAMHGVYQPLKRQPELDRPFATETREAVGAPKPSRIAVENHHPDAMWHRQLTNNPNTPMYSHAQIPLSPSWLPSRHAAAATSRHDIVTLSSGDTPIVSNAIVSTMHAPQQYMTTSSYRELPRDSHPRQNGDRDSDRVLLKRPLYEDRDLREGQYYQQGSLYSEPIRSERPPNFHPAMKEQYPLGQRERRPLPLDSGLENGWVNPKPMALERPEAVPVVMRTITNSVHKQDGRTRDAVHAPVHYYSQPSRAYPPMDDRFPAQREAIRRDDRRFEQILSTRYGRNTNNVF